MFKTSLKTLLATSLNENKNRPVYIYTIRVEIGISNVEMLII